MNKDRENNIFKNLLQQAGANMSSVVWKVIAIELLSLISDTTTPEIDGKAFKSIYRDREKHIRKQNI